MDIKPPSAKCKTPFLESNLAYLKPHDEVKIVVDTCQDLQFALDMEAYHSLSERFAFAISPTSAWGTPLTELQNKIMATGLDIRIAPQLHKHYFMDP
jgi:7-carboxy-7-deazaguanine synthase